MSNSVKGRIVYEVLVRCPHCQATLDLADDPYTDDSTEYCLAEDLLGLAVFGCTDKPAQWENLKIEYKCEVCDRVFCLTEVEY